MRKATVCFTTAALSLWAALAIQQACADATIGTSSTTNGSAQKSLEDDEVYDQLVSISAGTFTPRSAAITNGTYTFDYGGGATNTFLVQAGWAARLLRNFYFSENLTYSRFSGSASTVNASVGVPDTSLNVNLVGLDSRFQYSLDNFPVHWLIPFVEGGYLYTFYSQTGSSDLDSVQGGTGNFVAGAGVRVWINRSASIDTDLNGTYSKFPIFLTLKWNDIVSNGNSMDMGDSGALAGVSIGL